MFLFHLSNRRWSIRALGVTLVTQSLVNVAISFEVVINVCLIYIEQCIHL